MPEDKGRIVIAFLENFFMRYVEYDFTASLEEKLDLISNNELEWKDVLRDFWRDFIGAVGDIKDLRVAEVMDALNEMLAPHIFPAREDGSDPRICPVCKSGKLSLKPSKFGPFIGCGNYPDCKFTRQLTGDGANNAGDRELGFDPATGLAVVLKTGRFGPYVQLGEGTDDEKPKRSGLPKGVDAADIDFERAMQLLSLPREIGMHPETGTPITAGLGRYGPFILHDGTYANLENMEDVYTVGLNRAVDLLAEKRAGGGKSRFQRNAPAVLADLGEHPDGGGKIQVLSGRYGPYVSHNKVNATVPKSKEPEKLTVQEAVDLLNERIAKGGGKPARKGGFKKKAPAAKGEEKAAKPASKPAAKKAAPAKKVAASSEKAPVKAKAKSKTPPKAKAQG